MVAASKDDRAITKLFMTSSLCAELFWTSTWLTQKQCHHFSGRKSSRFLKQRFPAVKLIDV
jgi:hypothetical protein